MKWLTENVWFVGLMVVVVLSHLRSCQEQQEQTERVRIEAQARRCPPAASAP